MTLPDRHGLPDGAPGHQHPDGPRDQLRDDRRWHGGATERREPCDACGLTGTDCVICGGSGWLPSQR